jgi:hypothetical protein
MTKPKESQPGSGRQDTPSDDPQDLANRDSPSGDASADQSREPAIAAKPTGLLWFGHFAIPAEVAYSRKPSDPPYPMFFFPFADVDLASMPDPLPELQFEPGYGPPYDTAPQSGGSASIADAAAHAPNKSDPTSAEINSAGEVTVEQSGDRSDKS